jgi:hypothetical protein
MPPLSIDFNKTTWEQSKETRIYLAKRVSSKFGGSEIGRVLATGKGIPEVFFKSIVTTISEISHQNF